MNYRLIALDLDGTLYNDRKEITPATLNALRDAQDSGIRLMISSARPVPGLYRSRDALDMERHDGILMAYNGGRILTARDNQTLFADEIPLETARDMLKKLEDMPVTPILDDGRIFYVTDPAAYKVEYECKNNDMTCERVPNLAEFIHFAPAKILMSVQPEQIAEVQREIARMLPEGLTVVQTAAFYLEIIPKTVGKGAALLKVCEKLHIDPAQTIAFGDSENDISILRAAGQGVAMGNAAGNVKAAANFITLSNNEDGIAKALERLL